MQSIGERVRYLRNQLGMSMEAFSKAIDSTSANVSNIENNKSKPGGEILIKISNVCQVSADWILKGIVLEQSSDVKTIFFSPKWQIFCQIKEEDLSEEEAQRYQAVCSLVENIKELTTEDTELIAQLASKIIKKQ